MRSMYDALYLPAHTPTGYDAAAGYVASTGIAHAWSADDWTRAKMSARYLLPIAGGSLYGGPLTPEIDARTALARCPAGFPKGAALALDVEQYIAERPGTPGYVYLWAWEVTQAGYMPLIYCSASTAHRFPQVPLWTASWDRRPHLDPGAVATQYTSPTVDPTLDVDISVVADTLTLWDTRAGPPGPPAPPIPPEAIEMERTILTPKSGATAIETEPGKWVKVAHQSTVDAFRAAGWKACPVENDDYQRITGVAP